MMSPETSVMVVNQYTYLYAMSSLLLVPKDLLRIIIEYTAKFNIVSMV